MIFRRPRRARSFPALVGLIPNLLEPVTYASTAELARMAGQQAEPVERACRALVEQGYVKWMGVTDPGGDLWGLTTKARDLLAESRAGLSREERRRLEREQRRATKGRR